MGFELAGCTALLLEEIADPAMTRKDVAQTYALALRSSEKTDWAKVNQAILDRWSMSALLWIKTQAHSGSCLKGGRKMKGRQYYVTTWDPERQRFTPQIGVRTGPYSSLFRMRKALRKLRGMGYDTSRMGGCSVLIEARDH